MWRFNILGMCKFAVTEMIIFGCKESEWGCFFFTVFSMFLCCESVDLCLHWIPCNFFCMIRTLSCEIFSLLQLYKHIVNYWKFIRTVKWIFIFGVHNYINHAVKIIEIRILTCSSQEKILNSHWVISLGISKIW